MAVSNNKHHLVNYHPLMQRAGNQNILRRSSSYQGNRVKVKVIGVKMRVCVFSLLVVCFQLLYNVIKLFN